ncbi:hypothetical protein F5X97DRAFT_321799 [Nemania serpens]|nr:hypothetical protein F5X97DRAFT_321799 [Nemania serpens]
MPPTHFEEPKPYRLYVALYDLGPVYHWAFVVRGKMTGFLLDATVGDNERRYRKRNWDNDLSKRSITVLCDIMDLRDDDGVKYLLGVAEGIPMPDSDDQNFCQTWAESVLQRAGGNCYALRASIVWLQSGSFNVVCVTALAYGATLLTLWYTAGMNAVQVISFAPLFGFRSSAAISLIPMCIGQVCRTQDYGKRSGTALFLASFGAPRGDTHCRRYQVMRMGLPGISTCASSPQAQSLYQTASLIISEANQIVIL